MDEQDCDNPPITKDFLLKKYKKFHTGSKPDEDFKSLVFMGRSFLDSKKETFTYFNFYGSLHKFLKNSTVKPSVNDAALFKGLQKAYQKLEEYGIRLLKHPWRKEYYTIKLFTTFFKHEIESKDPNAASILELYGYKEKSKNIVEMPKYPQLDMIIMVSFELFLSTIELEVLFEIASSIKDYTEDFSLSRIVKARSKVIGNVDKVVEYLLKNKGISRTKRIKIEGVESGNRVRDKYENYTLRAKDEELIFFDKEYTTNEQKKSNRDTKYPPSTDSNQSVGSDNYGFSSKYTPLETQETHPLNERSYDHYEYMSSNMVEDDYEIMAALPPPQEYSVLYPEIPPPTYSQATRIPGSDYVVIENHDSRPFISGDALTSNISGFSEMTIGENGHDNLEGVQGRNTIHDFQRTCKPALGDTILTSSHSSASHYRVPQDGTAKVRTSSSSALKGNSDDVKERGDLLSDLSRPSGFDKDYKSSTSSTKSLGTSKLSKYDELSSKGSKDLEIKSSSSYDIKTKEVSYLPNHVTENYSKAPSSKSSCAVHVPKTTMPLYTTSYSKGSSKVIASNYTTRSTVTTRSQAREIEAREIAARNTEVLREPSQRASVTVQKTTERYSVENCNVCNNKVTAHYCQICKKRFCKDCANVAAKLPCDNHGKHCLVEERPSTNKGKDLDSKEQEYINCAYCGAGTPSHDCIHCHKKSCGKCHTLYRDQCASNNFELHFFVEQQPQKLTSEKKETTSQRQTLASKDIAPQPAFHFNGENICDFCVMAANLICKTCFKTICETCLIVYEKDLCPSTKKGHQFENIHVQSNQTTGQHSDSPWECERCTFSNSPSHRICVVCATSRGNQVEFLPKSGSRKCSNCTYGNEEGATVCKMCFCTFGLDKPESYI